MADRKVKINGFTLIELLVVIAIISLLVSILLPSLSQARELAQRTACASNMHTISVGLNMYYSERNDKMPPSRVTNRNPYLYWYDYIAPYINEEVDSNGQMIGSRTGENVVVCPTKTADSFLGEDTWPEGDPHWNSAARTDYLINGDLCPYWFKSGGKDQILGEAEGKFCKSFNALTETSRTLMLVDGMGKAYAGLIGEFCRTVPIYAGLSVRYRHSEGANALMVDSHVEYQEEDATGLDIVFDPDNNIYDFGARLWK